MPKNRFYTSVLALSISTILAACGGGGGGGGSTGGGTVTEKNGRAIDGPLAGSLVVFEDCGNKTTQTDAQGYFKFPANCTSSRIQISGGVDTTSNLAFGSILKAPRSNSGEVIVSPITTLIQTHIEANPNLNASTAATQIAQALGLRGTDLLTADPMDNQELYTKTVVVQQLVDQIKASIAPLGTSLSEEAITSATFAALSEALTIDNSPSSLQDPAIIEATISQTLTQIGESLAPEYRDNIADVSVNLAALATPAIVANVATVQETLESLTSTTFNQGVDAIQQATATEIQAAKESIVTQQLVSNLAEVLTLPSDAASTLLADVGSATVSTGEVNLTDALTELQTIAPSLDLEVLEQNLIADFYADYIELGSFSVLNTSYTIQDFNNSLKSPIQLSELNGLLLEVKGVGQFKDETVNVSAGLNLATLNDKQVTLTIDRLSLKFDSQGNLQSAMLPVGAKLNLVSNLNSVKSLSFSLSQSIDVAENGKVALNSAVLSKISAQFASLTRLPLQDETVLLTAVLQPANNAYVANKNANQKLVLSTKYQINAQSFGSGVSARFKVAR